MIHLGRLKMVVRRKEGRCVYKHCKKGGRVMPREKVFLLTKMGTLPGRAHPVVFYKAFHQKCFALWSKFVWETQTPAKDGRQAMNLSIENKDIRLKLVRERARVLRQIRQTTNPDKLTTKVGRIANIDREIEATGYPVLKYQGRRSMTTIKLEKFVQEVKDHYKNPISVGRDMYEIAEKNGYGKEFDDAMRKWDEEVRQKVYERTAANPDYEASQEDIEEE